MSRPILHLTCVLTAVAVGCTTGARATSPSSTTTTTSSTTTTTSSTTTTTTTTTTTAPVVRTSLPAWPTPRDPIRLPQPTGRDAVGVAASGFADTIVYYPAVAGTGAGHPRYTDPGLAVLAQLDPASMDRVVSAAAIDAVPAPPKAPRPIVILNPGWRSLIALSTALAEDLASHGYVVLASQTDMAAEVAHPTSTVEDRVNRVALLERLLDFATGPRLPALVGPVDVHRIAVGGHSYAGAIALDVGLTDRRVAAAIDVDGGARGQSTRPSPRQPTLLLIAVDASVQVDATLQEFAERSPNLVAVGVTHALHADVMDGGSIASLLGTSIYSSLLGTVGPTGTTDSAILVRRFLDAVLAPRHHLPTATELIRGLPSVTATPFVLPT